jgi:hypothetical protein
MNTTRHAIRVVTGLATSLLLLVTGTSGAWAAQAPDPGGPTGTDPVPVVVQQASTTTGLHSWQVIVISAVCAVLATLLTMAVARLLVLQHASSRRTARA